MCELDTVSEEVAKFLKKVHVERGWWCRIPLGDDSVHCKTENVFPSLSALFEINNQAIRVILLNTGILKT